MTGAGKKGSKTKTRDADEKTQQNGVEPTDPVTLNAIDSDTIADAIVKAFSSTDVLQRLQPILTEALKASVTDAVLTSVNDALNLELQSRDIDESWSPQNHSYPEKMFPSYVLISLEAEKNPLSLIENPHKSPFRKFFMTNQKSNFFRFCVATFTRKLFQ